VLLLLPLLLLTGCWAGQGAEPPAPGAASSPSPAGPRYPSYVALGDSYTAGPLVPTTDVAAGCFRSDHNYPSLLAKRLRVKHFRDVSCSAATTRDLAHRQHTFGAAHVPPQLRAVHRGTDLVTVGIGGNDLGLFGTLVQQCTRLRSSDPAGAPCTAVKGRAAWTRTTARIGVRVAHALRAVHRRAPHATVVLVGYLRLTPGHGTCPALPLATGDYALGRFVSRSLADAMRAAARRTGSLFLDAHALSRGHDVCSAHPWVNGAVADQQRAAPYHPFAAGMRAEAKALAALLQG
jgi:lysophospholipase L1-like esterase